MDILDNAHSVSRYSGIQSDDCFGLLIFILKDLKMLYCCFWMYTFSFIAIDTWLDYLFIHKCTIRNFMSYVGQFHFVKRIHHHMCLQLTSLAAEMC